MPAMENSESSIVATEKLHSDANTDKNFEDKSGGLGPKGRDIMLTDTVGFISKLPAHLVAAFRCNFVLYLY
jgi:hypothetical protein